MRCSPFVTHIWGAVIVLYHRIAQHKIQCAAQMNACRSAREAGAAKELAGASGFENFKGKYLEMLDKSGKSGIMEVTKGRTFEEHITNLSLLGESTPAEKYRYYKDVGFEVRPLGDGRFKGFPFEDGSGFRVYFDSSMQKMMMYHLEKRSHHTGEYYKLSEGKYGVHRFKMDGTQID